MGPSQRFQPIGVLYQSPDVTRYYISFSGRLSIKLRLPKRFLHAKLCTGLCWNKILLLWITRVKARKIGEDFRYDERW